MDSRGYPGRCSGDSDGEDPPFESLAMLEKLESLQVDRDVLFGNENPETRSLGDILPTHLEQFAIHMEWVYTYPDFYCNLVRSLLSHRTLTAIKVLDGDVDEAGEALVDIDGIELDSGVDPKTNTYDSIIIRKIPESAQASVVV